jgi:hypothetical protein
VPNTRGTKFNLNTGEILSKNFSIDSSGNAKFKGTVEATSGTFGSIITNQGLLSTLEFNGIISNNYNLFRPEGELGESYTNGRQLVIPYSIPSNFTVQSAYITFVATPIHWTDNNIWGIPNSIAVYKQNAGAELKAEFNSDFNYTTTNKTQINNVFGSGQNTWTPATPSSSSHNTQTKNTANLSTSYFSAGSNGQFIIIGGKPTGVPGTDYDKHIEQMSGILTAYLIVRGFTQP